MYYDQVTEFIFQQDAPQKCEFLFIPGSGYGELAIKAAQLYRSGYAGKIIVSGKYSILQDRFAGAVSPECYRNREYETESDFLKDVLIENGVREADIFQEKRATFTYENAIYIRCLLEKMGYTDEIMPKKVLLVCQAFHGARVRMYFNYMFPETEFYICPVKTQGIDRKNWYLQEKGIHTVLGEAERIGTQFTDIMMHKDETEKKCRKKLLQEEVQQQVRQGKTE